MRKLQNAYQPEREDANSGLDQSAVPIQGPGHLIVLQLLNMSPTVHSARVAEVVEVCHRIGRLEESIRRFPTRSRKRDVDVIAALDELNRLLRRYEWHPFCLRLLNARQHIKIFNRIVRTSTEILPELECLAIEVIIALIHDVRRIRRCQRRSCGKWYWAVRERQKYCEDKCRALEHQDGPEFKKKRADYMREIYRPREKKFVERSKELAEGIPVKAKRGKTK